MYIQIHVSCLFFVAHFHRHRKSFCRRLGWSVAQFGLFIFFLLLDFWPSGVKDCREQVKHLQSMGWSKGKPAGNHHFSHS